MGNDGGSIPKRRELVKEAARNPTAAELKETLQEQQGHLWNVDPLSQRPLSRPVVSDSLGRLFNKDSIIEFLLPSEDESYAKHAEQVALLKGAIKSLKDVVEIKFEIDEAATEAARGQRSPNSRTEVWVCPITREELGPATKAIYLVPCGHAFSTSAVKEVSGEHCLQCNEPYASNDIIPILPTVETDIARLTLRIKTLKEKGLAHSLKKASGSTKKRKKNGTDVVAETGSVDENSIVTAAPAPLPTQPRIHALKDDIDDRPSSKSSTPQPISRTTTPRPSNGTINNAATASLTAKVLGEQEERNKRRKIEANRNLNKLYTSSSDTKQRDIDFMNRGFSISKR